jgi:hypothetical protein
VPQRINEIKDDMKHTLFAVKSIIILLLFSGVPGSIIPATLKLTNKTIYPIIIEKISFKGLPVFGQAKIPVLPMLLEPDESYFYDAGIGGFQNVVISVKDKAHLRKTFNLNIEGTASFHLWELFTLGSSEEDNSEYLLLMGTGGILK